MESGGMRAIANETEEDEAEIERTSAAEATRLSFSMRARNGFFQRVINGARGSLPSHLAQFHAKPGFDLVKIWYDNERVHYETAIDLHREHIEIALHFEDGPISTGIYLRAFDAAIVEIKHELGSSVELERWTQSWGRLFELAPLTDLDAQTGEWAAGRITAFIAELQPRVEEIVAPRERSAQPPAAGNHRWRGKSRFSR